MCAVGEITINGVIVHKSNHLVRIGDTLMVPQGPYRRTVRVASLGRRRGPASEARRLYEEWGAPVRLADLAPAWEPLLAAGDLDD